MPKSRKLPKSRKMPKRRTSTKNVGKKRIGGMKSARTRREYYIDSWGKPHDKVFDKCFADLLRTNNHEALNKALIEEAYFDAKNSYYSWTRDIEIGQRNALRNQYKKRLCDIMKGIPVAPIEDTLTTLNNKEVTLRNAVLNAQL